jgi:hypothetical protein
MSKTTLNWIAAGLFAFAAIADFITGPLWLGILFAVLAVISAFTAVRG